MLYPVVWLGLWLTLTVYWLGLIEVGEGGGVKISLSNLFNYFSVSVVLWPQLVGGTTQKYHFFLTPPLTYNISKVHIMYWNFLQVPTWPQKVLFIAKTIAIMFAKEEIYDYSMNLSSLVYFLKYRICTRSVRDEDVLPTCHLLHSDR